MGQPWRLCGWASEMWEPIPPRISYPEPVSVRHWESLPANIMGGLNVAGKIIPAVGIGLLMLMMIKKADLWVFLIAGFALAVYLNLSVLAITLISLPLAFLYDLASQSKAVSNSMDDEEGELDL